jgi:hypothetical protein
MNMWYDHFRSFVLSFSNYGKKMYEKYRKKMFLRSSKDETHDKK